MSILEKTRSWFEKRISKPEIRIERKPTSTICTLTNSVLQKIDIVLDDWVSYVRVTSTYRAYVCVGSTIQDYSVLTLTPIKETGIEIATFTDIPSKIFRVKGSRSLSFIVPSNSAQWTYIELWGEDDL